MKIVHMADSHLGFSAYGRVDGRGRNLREETVYEGFERAVDKIVELRPDALVHAGDVFHHVRPRIKPLYVFKRALERLVDADIPVIIISGNHDAPKSQSAVSPFTLYEGMKDVHIAHRYRYEPFEVEDCLFHCIPFCLSPGNYVEEFKKISLSGKDVLVMHGMVEALWDKRLRTVGEHELKDSFLKSDFSYIALGHYHGQAQLSRNAWYSGSIEKFRFNEAGDEKGMLFVDLDKTPIEPEKIDVRVTEMLDPPPVDCGGLSSEEILDKVRDICQKVGVEGKIVRIKLKKVSRESYRNTNPMEMGRLRAKALHMEVLPEFGDEICNWEAEPMEVGQLPAEFKNFLEEESFQDNIPRAIRDDVISYGTELIKQAAETRTTETFDAPQ